MKSLAHVTFRMADRMDGARLAEVFRDAPFELDRRLAVDRSPCFFGLYDLQDAEPLVATICRGDRIEGVGVGTARNAWVCGERRRVGQLGDLCFTEAIRRSETFPDFFRWAFAEASRALDCEVWLASIARSSRETRRVLTGPEAEAAGLPVFRRLRGYSVASIPLMGERLPLRTGLRVHRATPSDLDAIEALLAADHETRVFGQVYGRGLVRDHLALWPGLRIDDFYVAKDGPAIVGVVAPWDGEGVRRYRVRAYDGAMRWLRRGWNVAARWGSFAPLPAPGEPLRALDLTHLSIPDEDPEILAALLDAVYADSRGGDHHVLRTCVLDGDPLASALEGYRVLHAHADLYAVAAPRSAWHDVAFGEGRPGLEIALL